MARIHRRAVNIVAYDFVGICVGIDDMAGNLLFSREKFVVCAVGIGGDRIFSVLALKS